MTTVKSVAKSVAKTRHFGGKLTDFNDKQERAFENKHLKAYLRGDKLFQYGYRDGKMGREPAVFAVKEVWS